LASALLAFAGLIQLMMPLMRLGAPGGLLGAPDGVFLEVGTLSLLAP
jgi:hypothetical protein